MPDQDDDLLKRLNALKPSSVNLGANSTSASVDIEVSKPQSREDKLAERLKGLRSGNTGSELPAIAGKDTADSLTSQVQDEVNAERDPITNWQSNETDDKALEDLLADLGSDDQWRLDPDDPKNIDNLLKEAKNALPPPSDPEAENTGDMSHEMAPIKGSSDPSNDNEEATSKTEDQQDEEEADDYVKRILAELEVEAKYDDQDGEKAESNDEASSRFTGNLPSTPSNIPEANTASDPPSYEDSELEARFSKLGLDLPSTPNTTPSAKAKAVHKANVSKLNDFKKGSNLAKYTDEDIDSWCCICNEDGEVKCLGCDGDIYCNNCWNEGHGNGPGQERGHRAIQYNRKGPAAAAA